VKKVRVRVPATSANLGPGYDVLGVALTLYNELELQAFWDGSGEALVIDIQGEGEKSLPRDQRNIAAQAALAVFKRLKIHPPHLRIRLKNGIPLASGLGSSAAACVGALVAANAVSGGRLTQAELIGLAAEQEGHPDNAVPALTGGLCISLKSARGLAYHKLHWPQSLQAVICVPEMTPKLLASLTDSKFKTHAMRALLAPEVKRQDAVFNIGRTALLISALTGGDYSLLGEAMQDRLHQPQRFVIFKGTEEAIGAALKAGAYGAALSGAGPGILAVSSGSAARRVAQAMGHSFKKTGRRAKIFILNGDAQGARVVA
jgi:homoserine kinase